MSVTIMQHLVPFSGPENQRRAAMQKKQTLADASAGLQLQESVWRAIWSVKEDVRVLARDVFGAESDKPPMTLSRMHKYGMFCVLHKSAQGAGNLPEAR